MMKRVGVIFSKYDILKSDICPHCGGKICYKIAKRNVYECIRP
ncbi:hypothetical protein FACS1894130_12280 [Spirochaetia bacterium]|nr:hypothetical protein FACS1894130_12280 [Spirochaetia bacterium]